MKWLKRLLLAALALALLVGSGVATVIWLLTAERGTQWLAARLLAAVPQLTVTHVGGSLLDGLVLEGVRWRSARDELDIDSLALAWNAPALLTGIVSLERAAATRVAYRRLPATGDEVSARVEIPWPIRLEQAAVGTLDVTVAEQSWSLADLRFTATLAGNRLAIDDATLRTGGAEVAGRATVDIATIELDLALDWAAPLAGVAANGRIELAGVWPALSVQHALAAPFPATSVGRIDFAGGAPSVDLTTEWRELAWPGVTVIASPAGKLQLTGTLASYRYEASGTLVATGRDARFALDGNAERLELAVERLEREPLVGAAEAGTLRARGSASLTARDAQLDVAAEGFDPKWLDARWAGRLSGTAALRTALGEAPRAAFDAIDLGGELNGYEVTLRGGATWAAPSHFALDALRLESAGNRLALSGTVEAERLDLRADAALDNLDLIAPSVRGTLRGTVAIAGTLREPLARGEVAADGIEAPGVRIERLVARGEMGLAPDAPVELTITAAEINEIPVPVQRIDVTLSGTTATHTANVAVRAEDWQATLGGTGGLTDNAWRGALERLEIAERVLGPWRLEQDAAVALTSGSATLDTACLVHVSSARWCTAFDLRRSPSDRVVLSGQNFDLASLRPLLPPVLTLDGTYQVSAALFDPFGEPRGALALTGETTRVRLALAEEQIFATELREARAGLTLTDGRLTVQASLASTTGGSADLTAAIADVRAANSAVTGTLQGEWSDLGFLTLLVPQIEEVVGDVSLDLTAGGTVDEPTVEGRAALAGGRITAPRLGLVVEGIEATATSPDGRSLSLMATGRAGDGVLTLTGTTALDPASGWPTRLSVRGDTVPLVQRADVTAFATPDLNIDLALPRVTITGSVLVPRANIELEALPAQAVTPSPDVVVHGASVPQATAQPLRVTASVELALGDDVRYSGLNLETKVSGGLRLETEPNRSAIASGTLTLAGTYNAYGQTLDLERGQLLFNGPLDNPGLDVSAVRTIETVRAGVELTGTLKEPQTRLFSVPSMSEADALSYLLFGRPASSSESAFGSEQASTLQAAALSLGLQQALPVVQRIGSSLGLDELTVRSTTSDAGALMAGKYLSPRLYVRYSYGLFNRIGGLLLRFKVNERLSLETRSGDQKSMDLLYTVEKE